MHCFFNRFKPTYWFALLFAVLTVESYGQSLSDKAFTQADTLRGTLSPYRSAYDVTYYHLDVKVDPDSKFINGSSTIVFEVKEATDKIQVDLYNSMNISKIEYKGKLLPFTRQYNAVFITFEPKLQQGTHEEIKVFYSGHPREAPNAPWDGGLVWSQDKAGNPWVGVAVQGDGASLWWPTKDHQSDEPDSMLISITVPKNLMDISNGRLRKVTSIDDQWTRYDWFVSYPINNYNVTLNIGKFAHIHDDYISGKDTLDLDFYVMPQNEENARKRFGPEVKRMMPCFEKYFGPYPFIRDGYKLIETPYDGMEHQSAISYGNHNFYYGHNGHSSSELGLKFDFIIVHESAHEWWGNNLTSNDIADMWVHESFGAYAESVFVECQYGYKAALRYVNASKPYILNDRPIVGPFGVNHEGSADMYIKGALVLNTLRQVIDDDPTWFGILRGLQEKYKYQTIDGRDVFNFINEKTGKDFTAFFQEYLYQAEIPELQVNLGVQGKKVIAQYRWNTKVKNFDMPVKVTVNSASKYEFIYPTANWQTIVLGVKPEDFAIASDLFLVNLKKFVMYYDEKLDADLFKK